MNSFPNPHYFSKSFPNHPLFFEPISEPLIVFQSHFRTVQYFLKNVLKPYIIFRRRFCTIHYFPKPFWNRPLFFEAVFKLSIILRRRFWTIHYFFEAVSMPSIIFWRRFQTVHYPPKPFPNFPLFSSLPRVYCVFEWPNHRVTMSLFGPRKFRSPNELLPRTCNHHVKLSMHLCSLLKK